MNVDYGLNSELLLPFLKDLKIIMDKHKVEISAFATGYVEEDEVLMFSTNYNNVENWGMPGIRKIKDGEILIMNESTFNSNKLGELIDGME